jgi:hypothetical protein
MVEKLMKKVLVIAALFIVLFQSFSIPVLATIQPWTGNPWSGDKWEGSPWDGADLEWKGDSWEGNPWEGPTTEGNDWEGNGTEGKGTEGNGTQGQDWSGYDWSNAPWYMDPWLNNGWSPNGFSGNGTTGSPFSGNGTTGNPFSGNGFTGNGTNGSSFSGDYWSKNPFLNSPFPPYSPLAYNYNGSTEGFEGDPTDVKLPMGFEVAKYISNDVIGGQVNMIDSYMKFDFENNPNGFRPNGTFFSTLMLNGVKLGLGENTPAFVNGIADTQDFYTKTGDLIGAAKDYKIISDARNISSAADDLRGAMTVTDNASDALSGLSKVGAISKLNVATAAVGAGYSAVELGFNGAKAYDVLNSNVAGNEKVSAVAEATGNFGDLLMNAGVVAAAVPGGQAAGAIMIAGGAAVWGASKLTKLVADNWNGIKKFAKDPVGNTKKAIKKGWSKIKGWFGN